MDEAGPISLTLRFVDLPQWVHELPRDCVIPALTRILQQYVPTRLMSNPNPDRSNILVQFFNRVSAQWILDAYNGQYNAALGHTILFEWSPDNLMEPGQRYVYARRPVTYRLEQPDVPQIRPPKGFAGLPPPLHPTDDFWFSRECPWQEEVTRQYRFEPPTRYI